MTKTTNEPIDITPEDSVVPVYLIQLTAEEEAAREEWETGTYQRECVIVQETRRQAYQRDADPLFFGYQRGDNTEQAWLDAVQAVKDAFPYPEAPSA